MSQAVVAGKKGTRLVSLVGVILFCAALYFAQPILIPFAIAFLLAFVLSPAVNWLERRKFPKVFAVVLVMVMALASTGALGWVVYGQFKNLIAELPKYGDNLRTRFADLKTRIQKPIEEAKTALDDVTQTDSGPVDSRPAVVEVTTRQPATLEAMLGPMEKVGEILAGIGLVVLLIAVLLLQKENLRDRFIRLAGGGQLHVTTRALDEASSKVTRYLLLTTLLNGAHGLLIGTGLFLLGVPNFMLWGLLSALLRYIPYIGPWIAAAFPVALALAISPNWTLPLSVIGMVLTLELISNNILEPWIYGARTGISPSALIIAAIFWTWIWGTAGLFLATPLTVCLAVLGKHVPALRFLHVMLGDEPALTAPEKLYQRLLAGDSDEAWEIVLGQLATCAPIAVYDQVFIPALAIAERDLHFGTLDQASFDDVAHAMRDLIEETGDMQMSLELKARTAAAEKMKKDDAKDPDKATAAGADALPPPTLDAKPIPALCIPAQDEGDRVVAIMAAQCLAETGFAPEVVSTTTLTGELTQIVRTQGIKAVIVSNLPPAGIAQVRYICKRLAPDTDGLVVVVGLWGANEEEARKVRERLPEADAFKFVTTLKEAIDHITASREALSLGSSADEHPAIEEKNRVEVRAPAAPV